MFVYNSFVIACFSASNLASNSAIRLAINLTYLVMNIITISENNFRGK